MQYLSFRSQPDSLFVEDPTILSGTLRSTLDVFDEYEDADIVRHLCLQPFRGF